MALPTWVDTNVANSDGRPMYSGEDGGNAIDNGDWTNRGNGLYEDRNGQVFQGQQTGDGPWPGYEYNYVGHSNYGSGSSEVEMPDYSGVFAAMGEAQQEANDIAMQQLGVSQSMLGISEKQAAIAEERYNYWKTNFMPMEQELIQQAKVGTDAEYAANVAGNRIGQGFKSAEGVGNRFFERLGISKDDPRLASMTSDMQFAERAATAGAKNNARMGAMENSKAMRLAVAGMGRGVSADSLSAFGNSARSMGMAGASMAQAGDASFSGAAGVADSQLAGMRAALNSSIGAANASTNYNQFLAERSFQQGVDAANTNAMNMQAWGQLGGTAAGVGVGYAVDNWGNKTKTNMASPSNPFTNWGSSGNGWGS